MDDRMAYAWERQDGEPNRWFGRFTAYRLLGSSRSIEAVYRAECEANHREVKRPSRLWYQRADEWRWRERSAAWDQHLADEAAAEIETTWRAKVMGGTEVLGRMSEAARNDMGQYFKISERWTEEPLPTEEIIDEEDREIVKGSGVVHKFYLVRKVVLDLEAFLDPERSRRIKKFADSPKNGLSIELYDAQAAQVNLGKHHKLFNNSEDDSQAAGAGAFSLPADVIAPSFLTAYRDIRDHQHTEYLFFGGRGSTKSSFVSLAIIWLLVNNPTMHALAMRQVKDTLRDSVYSQLVWAINELNNYSPGLAASFKCTTNPLEIEYRPTGQKIYFRGADDPGKIKSIKPAFGYIGIAWFEELDQFHGPEAIRKIEQSAIRGGDLAYIFKSFNPPRTLNNWANKYAKVPKATQYQHKSDYLSVPPEWLGKTFIEEAEFLKEVNPGAYEHEYLGIANSAGGLVFENVQLRKITDTEIAQFDRVLHGVDWGYYPDPWHYVRCHYDAARLTLFIFGELRKLKASNRDTYQALVNYGLKPSDLLIADSSEPKSVADYREFGLSCRGAEKGPESVKYSMKWMQSLKAIVIDPERCPEAAAEFIDYEYERDKDDEYISEYPDKNNHAIDGARYATNLIWRKRGQ